MDAAPTSHWPLFDLRIRTDRLELRLPTDDDLMALADVVRVGGRTSVWLRHPAMG